MRVNDLPLEERASPVLYHYTTPRAALNILRSGEFQLSSVVGNPSEQQLAPKGHPYFLSTTRSRVGDYHRYTHNSAVMFTLDGDWFNRNYKVRPVDFWERAWDYPQSNRTRESEDRVFSREATIPANGVRAVHVLVKGQDDRNGSNVRKVLIAAKQRGIPAHLYQDERAWRVQDTSKTIPMDQARDLLRGREASSWGGRGRRYLEPWVELIHKNKTADLSADAAKLAHNIVYYHRGDPTEDMNLGIDLSNARKPGETDRPLAVKLISYLKKFDFDTKKMVKDLHDKWAEIKTQEYEAKRAETKEDISESLLTEVNMSPSALEAWARSPDAEGIRAGFEAELIFRDTNRDDGDEEEYEPDYEMDERAHSISQVIEFFQGGDSGISSRTAQRLETALQEEFWDWQSEAINDAWESDSEEIVRDYMETNVWANEQDQYRERAAEDLGIETSEESAEQSERIEARARELFDEDVEREINEQGGYWDEANEYFADMAREDGDYDEDAFLSDRYRYMTDIENAHGLDWPYWRGGESERTGSRDADDIASSLRRVLDGDYEVKVGSGYHSVSRRDNRWIIEPDGSLDPDDRDEAGLEVVSPPMPLAEALDKLEKVLEWANDEADAYTNSSTGLHMGVSVPHKGGAVDYVKLVLFMGDEYVLDQFGRAANTYAASAMEKLRQNMAASRQDRRKDTVNPKAVVDLMQKNLIELAGEFIRSGVGESKYTSAHIKDGYIEFRSPGGDYLSMYSDNLGTIKNTMLRFARAMHIASRPDLERKEYATKLYKLVAPRGDDALKLFALYASKNINIDQLKADWANSVLAKEGPAVFAEPDDSTPAAKTRSRRAQIARKIAGEPRMFLVTDRYNNKRLFVRARNVDDAMVQAGLEDEDFARSYERGDVTARLANGEELAQLQHRPTTGAVASRWRVSWVERRTERGRNRDVEDSVTVDATDGDAAKASVLRALQAQDRNVIAMDVEPAESPVQSGGPIPGSTMDLAQRRAAAAQPQGEFTGRWQIRNATTGEVVHTISGVGNVQADANRVAQQWVQQTRFDDPVEVVPEMAQ